MATFGRNHKDQKGERAAVREGVGERSQKIQTGRLRDSVAARTQGFTKAERPVS